MKDWNYFEWMTYNYSHFFDRIHQKYSPEAANAMAADNCSLPDYNHLSNDLVDRMQFCFIQVCLREKINPKSLDSLNGKIEVFREHINLALDPREKEYFLDNLQTIQQGAPPQNVPIDALQEASYFESLCLFYKKILPVYRTGKNLEGICHSNFRLFFFGSHEQIMRPEYDHNGV